MNRPVPVLARAALLLLLLVAAAVGSSGCASSRARPVFIVDDSQLNWLSVRYRPADPLRPPCTLSLFAAGYIQIRAGGSPLVGNSFATDTEDARWNDLREEKVGMSPAEARGILQLFADAGLVSEPPRPKRGDLNEESPGIAVFRYRLNGDDGACITANPELILLLNDLLDQLGYGPGDDGR